MKPIWKVLLIILAVVIVAGGAVYIWQKDNINALIVAKKYSGEELTEIKKENDKKLETIIEEHMQDVVRPLTEDEKKDIESGEKSIVSVVGDILKEQADSPAPAPEPSGPDAIITGYVTKLYELKDDFIFRLANDIIKSAFTEYSEAVTNGEKTSKFSVYSKYLNSAMQLESDCDKEVEALLNNMKNDLSEAGGDLSAVDTLREAYENEKLYQKAMLYRSL